MRRTKQFLCLLLALLLALPSSLVADTILVVNRSQAFLVDTVTGKTTTVASGFDVLHIDSSVTGGPKPGPDDPDQPDDPDEPDPDDTLVDIISRISRQHLDTEKEARALVATAEMLLNLMNKGALKESQLDEAIKASLGVIGNRLESTDLKAWWSAVKSAAGGRVTESLLLATITGLGEAFNFDGARYVNQVSRAWQAYDGDLDFRSAAQAAARDRTEALDIASIMAIVQAIIELLKLLGIIGG